jgi:quercetin dioxygenase-like cupin family protein
MQQIIPTTTRKTAPMKQTVVMLAVALALGIAVGMIGSQVLNAQQEPVTRTVLLKTDLAGIEGKEANMFLANIAPGAATPKHYHPGHEFAYVLEGSGILEEEGKAPVTLKPEVFFYLRSSSEKAEYVHAAKNTSATDPLKILAVLITEKGQPLAVPVK